MSLLFRSSDHWILVPLRRWYRLVIDPLGGADFIHRVRLSSGQHCSPAIHSVGHLVTTVSSSDMSYQQLTWNWEKVETKDSKQSWVTGIQVGRRHTKKPPVEE
ncbi:hypothetical protein ZIOFF_035426 [Zingiber officinale]|uniref:Uncharacterized protein n=1 Tax=Zingiber officinale TaxID=94328 RepID=A0A8J5G9Q1_ZINOF|nr:hypothetical protein ZIOFF_035426 [Zingiber officinale]